MRRRTRGGKRDFPVRGDQAAETCSQTRDIRFPGAETAKGRAGATKQTTCVEAAQQIFKGILQKSF